VKVSFDFLICQRPNVDGSPTFENFLFGAFQNRNAERRL